MEILKEKITCPKTLALIKSSLEAGYIEFGGLCEKAMLGTPQGSVLSPLLSNIYLHKLDCFMEDLMEKHNKGTKRR
jgi:retron-type reverse transcriptase